MTPPATPPQPPGLKPSSDFVEQVRTILEQLYDFAFLQTHPLAQRGMVGTHEPDEMAGHQLRRELTDAIEALNPDGDVPLSSPRARLYHLLHMHYVDRITVQKAAGELGISLRQAHRDLRRGEESVATVVWARRCDDLFAAQVAGPAGVADVEHPRGHSRLVNLCDVVEHGCRAVGKLTEARGVGLRYIAPDKDVLVLTDPVVAQQVWISLLSYTVGHAQPGPQLVQLRMTGDGVAIVLSYGLVPGVDNPWQVEPAVSQLASRLDWALSVLDEPAGAARCVTIRIPARRPTVLVVDDSAGMIELVEHYLAGQACRVVSACNGRQGVQMAQSLLPEAIILDVMMPEMDGWEVLQALRGDPATRAIPVVICSVIHNPELAASFGGTLHLSKPVRRDSLYAVLHQAGVIS